MANTANTPRSIEELERKYNFAKLLGFEKNIKLNKELITKVENELLNILNALIINLKDVLEDQSEVSLWFFNGMPTLENKPYADWENPEEHVGDIYYDQSTGYVYQYFSDGWKINTDTNLVQAMALTNIEVDTTTDNERKVYFSQPVPPYSSGDWWILEDGTLKICQIGKTSGEYEINDFIISSGYVATVATKTGNELTVLKGTVTEITENYVKYTDLSTGGSTIINGANISTGNINTDNVSIGNGNVRMDKEGIYLSNGAKVVGENGLMNTYIYTSQESFRMCGYEGNDTIGLNNTEINKLGVKILFNIPEGLNIMSAKLILFHAPTNWEWVNESGNSNTYWGYCRNLKVYKASNINSRIYEAYFGSEYLETKDTTYSEISKALGENGWTPSEPTDELHNTEMFESIDIKDSLSNGLNEIIVQPSIEATQTWNGSEISKRTAFIYVMIKIDGYMSY